MRTKQLAYFTAFAVLSVTALYFAAIFLIPIVLAGLLAMLLTKLSEWLEHKGLNRGLSSSIAVLVFLLGIGLLGIAVYWQLSDLTANINEMKEQLANTAEGAREWVSETIGISTNEQKKMIEAQQKEASSQANSLFLSMIDSFINIAVNAILVIVYVFLFLYYRSHLKRFVLRVIPEDKQQNGKQIIDKSVVISGSYLMGLFSMIAMLWVMYAIGFGIVGLEGAIFFAIICGILEIIPFLGNLVGNLIAIFAALAQGGDVQMVIGIIAIYLTVQFLQTYLLEPLVVGQQVNINPLFTIMGLVAGQLLWGIAGLALAIPVLGIVKIICDNTPSLQAYGMLIGPANTKRKNSSPVLDALKRLFGRE